MGEGRGVGFDDDLVGLPATRNELPLAEPSIIGRVIGGNFRVAALIGTGAMGHVYQAEQLSLGKMVALKLLRHELMGDEKLIKRFELEAKSASQLDHPNSIQIIDFGRDRDLLYIAMELLPGVDLGQLILREGPLPAARIGRIMDQVLAALDEAHANGIVHRDLKPGNIMLVSRRGEPDYVKVCDFGIAKVQTSTEAAGLTLKGLVCGTPEYMSPEQARGEEVDGRSDLYAVGVILYQLVTGELPFTASSPVGILSKHLAEDPVRPSLRQPGLHISSAFEAVILRALAKEPADRPASAQELRRLLRAALADVTEWSSESLLSAGPTRHLPSQPTTPVGRAMPRAAVPDKAANAAPATASVGRARRALVVTLVLLGAGGAGGWLWLKGPARHPDRQAAAVASPTLPAATAIPIPSPPPAPPAAVTPEAEVAAPAPEIVPPEPAAAPPARALSARPRPAAPRVNRRVRPEVAAAPADEPVVAPVAAAAPGADGDPAAVTAPAALASAPVAGDPLKEAERLMAQGEVAAACKKLEEQRVMTPKLPSVYKLLGKCYMRSGQPERAKDNYRQYLLQAPDPPDAAFIKSIVR